MIVEEWSERWQLDLISKTLLMAKAISYDNKLDLISKTLFMAKAINVDP